MSANRKKKSGRGKATRLAGKGWKKEASKVRGEGNEEGHLRSGAAG